MANLYDAIDLLWDCTNGDFIVSHSGDLADTSQDALEAVLQDVYTRVKSDRGDWSESPLIGASLSDFAGEPNTQRTGTSIQQRVINTLLSYGTISGSDITVDVFPISKEKVMVEVSLRVSPSVRNKGSRVLKKTFVYSFVENNVYPRG